jgi:DNA replication initiation complex subunit (GINS family)
MADIIITYETLFDILRKEKSRQDLQQLPEDFYGQAVAYVRKKRAEVEAAGGFGSPAAQRPLVQFRNVQKILRELYERRERKIVEMALNRARTESNIVDVAPLLSQERGLYEEATRLLSSCKQELLEPTLKGEAPDGVAVPTLPAEQQVELPAAVEATGGEAPGPTPEEVATRESCDVKFLHLMPRFYGLKGEVLGPFEPGERVELSGKIAAVLLRKRRVEIL